MEVSACGKISTTKLSFTLPISCQICLEKVKEPVTCPNQHVFCAFCMEVWLERNKQCPTCRVDITPHSPMRKIIGGQQTQSEEIRSPRTSKQLRRARMELLFRDYENEIAELQREVGSLKHSNKGLKSRLAEEEQRNMSHPAVPKSKCSRCGNMKDIDSMLEMAKNLQEATRTFEQMKEENLQLKQTNERLLKELDDFARKNASVKEELLMRSPMKFGRLTVATLESRIEAYEKQISQLKKAMEKSDIYTESLQEKLNNCSCGGGESKDKDTIILNETVADITDWSGHDYNRTEGSVSQPLGTDVGDGVATYSIQNILTNDLVNQAFTATLNENSVDQGLFLSQQGPLKSPFTPSAKLSKLTLTTPKTGTSQTCEANSSVDFGSIGISVQPGAEVQETLTWKDQDPKARSFTAQMMPPIESPDYKEKLEQIQDNLLHPITSTSNSPVPPGQTRSFSRRLTFDDTLLSASNPDISDLNYLEETTRSSCSEEPLLLTPNEDSVESVELEHQGDELTRYMRGFDRSHDDSQFVHPQSVLHDFQVELSENSTNPVLGSGSYHADRSIAPNQVGALRREVSLSVVEAGGSRITTTKLSQSDRDVFTRPSSAPSRTFLLSGSRFSALRPLDPTSAHDDLSQFQPVKCKSPSPLSSRKLQSNMQTKSTITPKKEGIRCVVDGRASSPMLKLVSPDEVIGANWKQTSCYSRSSSGGDLLHEHSSQKPKDKISRVAILKRNSSGKPSSYKSSLEIARSPPVGTSLQYDEAITSSSRRSARKQCLNDPNAKRVGEHSLEFLSPVKSPKIESGWNWNI